MTDPASILPLSEQVIGPAEVSYEDFELPAGTDLVSIIFVQPRTAFQYLRSTILSRAPDSIFAYHFGTGGVNEGKETLPNSYTLDRDAERFGRYFDPWLRGLETGAIKSWKKLDEADAETVTADAMFYGFPADQLPVNTSAKPLLGRPRVSFREGARLLKTSPPKWEQDVDSSSQILRVPFVVESKNTYLFDTKWERRHSTRLDSRSLSQYEDPDEEAFWIQVRSLAPEALECTVDNKSYNDGKEAKVESYPKPEVKDPFVCVEMRAENKKLLITVHYCDRATLESPTDYAIRRVLGRDDTAMFRRTLRLK